MNVLLITFSFPPVGGVGVLRALSLAKYLPSEGIRVDVLTARNAPAVGRDLALLQQVPEAVTVHRTWTLDLPFSLRKGIKKLLTRGKAPASPRASPTLPARPGFLQRMKGLVANLLLPDPQIGWLPFAAPAARRIIRTRKIDAVIITVPPFSSVKLAARLRKSFPGLPIILDFRDEWLTTTLGLVSFNSNELARRVARETESEAVAAATAVVAVTHNAADALRERYPHLPATKFLTVPNGYDDSPARGGAECGKADKVTLTYMGSVYGSTDPRSLLAAVAELPDDVRGRLCIRFIGHVETDTYRQALAALSPTVELVGFLPQSEALRQLAASHYALLITHDPINVSAKFYDYLGAGKPIVAAVQPQGEVRRLLDETAAGEWASINDPAALRQLLINAVNRVTPQGLVPYRPNTEAVASYHRKPLTQRYATLLHSFARERA